MYWFLITNLLINFDLYNLYNDSNLLDILLPLDQSDRSKLSSFTAVSLNNIVWTSIVVSIFSMLTILSLFSSWYALFVGTPTWSYATYKIAASICRYSRMPVFLFQHLTCISLPMTKYGSECSSFTPDKKKTELNLLAANTQLKSNNNDDDKKSASSVTEPFKTTNHDFIVTNGAGKSNLSTILKENPNLPVIIFCHGLGENSMVYSQLEMAYAQKGYIVICPTFNDGSACVSILPPLFFNKKTEVKGEVENILLDNNFEIGGEKFSLSSERYRQYKFPSPLWDWETEKHFRSDQLNERVLELDLLFEILLENERSNKAKDNIIKVKVNNQNSFETKVNDNNSFTFNRRKNPLSSSASRKLFMVGHSFGAATIVKYAKERKDFVENYVSAICLLDGWWKPLAHDEQIFPSLLEEDCCDQKGFQVNNYVPSLLMHCELFQWDENAKNESRLINKNSKPGYSHGHPCMQLFLDNCGHLNFSDFALLAPELTAKLKSSGGADALQTLITINNTVLSFFDNYLEQAPEEESKREISVSLPGKFSNSYLQILHSSKDIKCSFY